MCLNKIEDVIDRMRLSTTCMWHSGARILANIDDVRNPDIDTDKWKGIDDNSEEEPSKDLMLHDKLYDSYWDLRKRRENKDWKLDNYEG